MNCILIAKLAVVFLAGSLGVRTQYNEDKIFQKIDVFVPGSTTVDPMLRKVGEKKTPVTREDLDIIARQIKHHDDVLINTIVFHCIELIASIIFLVSGLYKRKMFSKMFFIVLGIMELGVLMYLFM